MMRVGTASLLLLLSMTQIRCGAPAIESVTPEEPMPAPVSVEFVRPVHFGRMLPYPLLIPEFVPDTAIIQPSFDHTFSIRLAIDSLGNVTALEASHSADSAIIDGYTRYFKSIKFKPGQIDSVDVSFGLAMTIDVGPAEVRPELRFPLTADGNIADADLYFESLSLNGIELPAIKLFPPYGCSLKSRDTAVVFPHMIFKVDLDETGSVSSAESLVSTYPKFTDHLQTAIYWGEYSPLKIDGVAVTSTNFLIISFYPAMAYPTRVLPTKDGSPESIFDAARVRLVADTIGLLHKPFPHSRWTGTLAYGLVPLMDKGPASILVDVDALGVARVVRISPKVYRTSLTRWDLLAQKFRWYSARDFHENRTDFRGRIRVDYVADTIVRIQPEWLVPAALDFAP